MTAGAVPADDVEGVGRKLIEQVTAGEAGGSGDKGRTAHARQRGTPPRPPLNGEKLPSPASVNDRKNR